ncbi:protein of unknown function [Hyphomicrobium sp. 1Nfss2.1]
MTAQVLRMHRLAGFGAADFDVVAPARCAAELVIERQHAIDFGARAIKHVGDGRQHLLRHISKLMLKLVEDLEQFVRAVVMSSANGQRKLLRTEGWLNHYFWSILSHSPGAFTALAGRVTCLNLLAADQIGPLDVLIEPANAATHNKAGLKPRPFR